MRRLDLYVAAGAPDAIAAMLSSWREAGRGFFDSGALLQDDAKNVEDGFSATSMSGQAARSDMNQSGVEVEKKYTTVSEADMALAKVQSQVVKAMEDHAVLSASLPPSHDPVNPADFDTEVKPGEVNERQAEEGKAALEKAQAKHAAEERAIAHAEKVAAARIRDYDTSVDEAEPKVRALYDDGSGQSNAPSNPVSTPSTVPGSASAIAASRARMAKYNPGVSYAEGDGYDLIQKEKDFIAAEEAKNEPEWTGTEWVNADGSPAPATSYASIETADGLAPLAGGTNGAVALGVGLGGAALAGGIAKAVASKFATPGSTAGRAQAAKASGSTAKTAAGARGAGGTAGKKLTGAGGRGMGGAGSRAGGRGPGGAGSRTGAKGTGAGGRGAGKKRDDNTGSQDQDWTADYTDDWTDPNYRVWDPSTDSGRPIPDQNGKKENDGA
ncbi:hypothetical protein ACIA03_08495 [Nocardioides sp. NPDC051685]|uniref:hypothetical protein n=1 Tax=Nocardioides sp. NPDC051685 TaxID=3364334 RepID=UPI00378E0874